MAEPEAAWPNVTIEELLAETVGTLRQCDQTDVALLDVLEKHILTLPPAKDAVAQAVNEIEVLAAKRGEGN